MLKSDTSLTRLRILAEVGRRGSMTAAARALSYTPSAISQQVRRLELDVGQPLVDRHPRGVTLTEAGQVVLEHVTAIERSLDSLRGRLDDMAGLRAGSITLGTFPTVGSSLLPLALARFAGLHPGVKLAVHSARMTPLLDLLARREVDLAVLYTYEWTELDLSNLHLEVITEDPAAIIVSASHPMADRSRVRMRDLRAQTWITRTDSHPMAELLAHAAGRAGFEPTIAFEADDYQEAQAMVAVGMGIAIAPRLALTNLRSDVRVLSIDDYCPSRTILLGRLASRTQTPAEAAMTEILVQLGRSTFAQPQ